MHVRELPYPQIDPVFLHLGPLQFRWYGLMYLLALTAAYFVIKRRAPDRGISMSQEQLYDLIVYAAVGIFAGGRLGYVLFYNLPYYLEHPTKIVAVWEGGMSFHGGLLGTIVAILLFCRRRHFPIYPVADLAALAAPIGLGLGRLGNFINAELYGRVTDVPWCMRFPYIDSQGAPHMTECRHPSQLYEAGLEGVLLFTVVWLLSRRRTPPGTLFWTLIMGYGMARLFVEFFREPDQHLGFIFGPFSMGQLLSVPMIVIGAAFLAAGLRKRQEPAVPTPSRK